MAFTHVYTLLIYVCLLHVFSGATTKHSTKLKIINKCNITIWPGILSNSWSAQPPSPTTGSFTLKPGKSAQPPSPTTGSFTLKPGKSYTLSISTPWSGRLWGQTHCTSGCGEGGNPTPQAPSTLVEFSLNRSSTGLDFYDVSLVDGYNLPVMVFPRGENTSRCQATGCSADLNVVCPKELRVFMESVVVACKSACAAFGKPEYCCTGPYAASTECKASSYSELFERWCPLAHSFAYDKTTTFSCAAEEYVVVFCPSSSLSRPSNYSLNEPNDNGLKSPPDRVEVSATAATTFEKKKTRSNSVIIAICSAVLSVVLIIALFITRVLKISRFYNNMDPLNPSHCHCCSLTLCSLA